MGDRTRKLIAAVVPVVLATIALAGAGPASATELGWQANSLDLGSIAPDEDGGYVGLWGVKSDDPSDSTVALHARFMGATGNTALDQNLQGRTFLGASLSANGQGDAIAAWGETSNDCCTSLSAVLSEPGSLFDNRVDVPYGDGHVSFVRTAINSNGDSVIVYGLGPGDNTERLWAVFHPAGGDFSDPVPVSESINWTVISWFDVSLDDDGEAVVAWNVPSFVDSTCGPPPCTVNQGPWVIRAAVGTSAGFGTPQTLFDDSADVGRNASGGDVAMDASGGAVVSWVVDDGGISLTTMPVFVSTRPPGESFGAATQVGHGEWAGAGASSDGHALLGWTDPNYDAVVLPVNTTTGQIGAARTAVTHTQGSLLGVGVNGDAVLEVQADQRFLLARGDISGAFGPLRVLKCLGTAYRWSSLPAVGPEGNAAALFMPWDEDLPTAVVRSQPSPAPLEDCSEPGDTLPPADPVGPTLHPSLGPPKLALMRGAIHLSSSGHLPVMVVSTQTGRLRVWGTLRIGKARVPIRAKTIQQAPPGTVHVDLPVPPRALRALQGKAGKVRAALIAEITSAEGGARAKGTVRVRR